LLLSFFWEPSPFIMRFFSHLSFQSNKIICDWIVWGGKRNSTFVWLTYFVACFLLRYTYWQVWSVFLVIIGAIVSLIPNVSDQNSQQSNLCMCFLCLCAIFRILLLIIVLWFWRVPSVDGYFECS
jgi:uncharacterized membrane protein